MDNQRSSKMKIGKLSIFLVGLMSACGEKQEAQEIALVVERTDGIKVYQSANTCEKCHEQHVREWQRNTVQGGAEVRRIHLSAAVALRLHSAEAGGSAGRGRRYKVLHGPATSEYGGKHLMIPERGQAAWAGMKVAVGQANR